MGILGWIKRIRALAGIAPDIKRLIQLWKGDDKQGSIRDQAMKALKDDPEIAEFIETLDEVVDKVGDIL